MNPCRLLRLWAALGLALFALLMASEPPAGARIVRIVIDEKQSPAYGGRSFGNAGPYERITGRAFGEIDPRNSHNAIINDIGLAPRNTRGLVEYVATFSLWKPVDMSKASGVLIDAVPNRGNRLLLAAFHVGGDPGDGFFFQRGDILLSSGWQGDLPVRPGAETITVPPATNPDHSSITGPVLARFHDMPARTITLSLPDRHVAASVDTRQAELTRRASEDGAVLPIGAARLVREAEASAVLR